jgi:hypothetical protein
MTEEETDEDIAAENATIEAIEELLRYLDSSTQTFTFTMLDYNTGDYTLLSNAYTAEEAMNVLQMGVERAKEDCLEENKVDFPIDNRFH